MVGEAEKFKDADDKQAARIHAKNSVESYAYHVKSTLNDDPLKSKIQKTDRDAIEAKANETIAWLDGNQTAEKDEFESIKQELEAVVNPIMQKFYAGGPQAAQQAPGAKPQVEEVD